VSPEFCKERAIASLAADYFADKQNDTDRWWGKVKYFGGVMA